MPYAIFQPPGKRQAVGICPTGSVLLALAVANLDDHPFDLNPVLLDRATAEVLRDALTVWLESGQA